MVVHQYRLPRSLRYCIYIFFFAVHERFELIKFCTVDGRRVTNSHLESEANGFYNNIPFVSLLLLFSFNNSECLDDNLFIHEPTYCTEPFMRYNKKKKKIYYLTCIDGYVELETRNNDNTIINIHCCFRVPVSSAEPYRQRQVEVYFLYGVNMFLLESRRARSAITFYFSHVFPQTKRTAAVWRTFDGWSRG